MSDIKNIRFGVCNVCLKPICQCPKPKAPHALTREEQSLERVIAKAGGMLDSVLTEENATLRQALAQQAQAIDALRAECRRIECINAQQAQEVERLKHEKADLVQRNQILRTRPDLPMTHEDKAAFKRLEQQLAAMTAERDNYGLRVQGSERQLVVEQKRIVILDQQLAASQARVKELEQPRLTLAECVVVDYLEKEVDQLLPMLGVEAALITDLSHVGDFPDDQLGAEKYVWQAAIDFLRTQLATLQATLAAREAEFQEAMQQAQRALKGGR